MGSHSDEPGAWDILFVSQFGRFHGRSGPQKHSPTCGIRVAPHVAPQRTDIAAMSEAGSRLLSRRRFLQSLGVAGLAGASGSLLAACGGPTGPCAELTDLSEQEKEQRQQMVNSLNYVHESPNENQRCDNCQLFLSEEYGEGCGGCQLFPGPVHAGGYCDSWMKST